MSTSALVAGSTGLVGNHLVKLLVQSGKFAEIKVLVRTGSNYINSEVFVVEVDFDHLAKYKDQLQSDVFFCCLGTTIKKAGSKDNFYKVDFTYPHELAKIAIELGASQFNIITALGASSKSTFFYNRVKGDIEDALTKLEFQNLNIFRPSLLLGKRNENRLGEQIGSIISRTLNPVLIGRLRKYRGIQAEVVARAMLSVSLKKLTGVQIFESDTIQALA